MNTLSNEVQIALNKLKQSVSAASLCDLKILEDALRKEREAAVPVAWLRESALKDIHKDAWTPLIVMENRRDGVDLSESYEVSFIPLYTSPPAQPVAVPDDADPRDEFESQFPIPRNAQRCGKGYVCTSYSGWAAHEFINKWEGWKACRAAMLAAAPGKEG